MAKISLKPAAIRDITGWWKEFTNSFYINMYAALALAKYCKHGLRPITQSPYSPFSLGMLCMLQIPQDQAFMAVLMPPESLGKRILILWMLSFLLKAAPPSTVPICIKTNHSACVHTEHTIKYMWGSLQHTDLYFRSLITPDLILVDEDIALWWGLKAPKGAAAASSSSRSIQRGGTVRLLVD